mmetsp:Transcript_1519/g.4634  ORF Transcript_1519/g.4634 Transcript_1519/m.4634 type:complete len:329 (+) Transcript_1519:622-1608(+)
MSIDLPSLHNTALESPALAHMISPFLNATETAAAPATGPSQSFNSSSVRGTNFFFPVEDVDKTGCSVVIVLSLLFVTSLSFFPSFVSPLFFLFNPSPSALPSSTSSSPSSSSLKLGMIKSTSSLGVPSANNLSFKALRMASFTPLAPPPVLDIPSPASSSSRNRLLPLNSVNSCAFVLSFMASSIFMNDSTKASFKSVLSLYAFVSFKICGRCLPAYKATSFPPWPSNTAKKDVSASKSGTAQCESSMLVRHPCMALVPNFTLAFPPSELSFSFTGCERYAPMSFTSFTSSSPKCLQLFPENDRDRCVVRTPINAHFLKPRVCPTRAT